MLSSEQPGTGKVKFWKDSFGFIKQDGGGPDLWIGSNLDSLSGGDLVAFTAFEKSPNRWRAKDVRLIARAGFAK